MSWSQPPIGDTDTHYQPVQVETPYSLTGFTLSDGSAILCWVLGQSTDRLVRWAKVSSPRQWTKNGSVSAGDVGTAVDLSAETYVANCSGYLGPDGYPYIVASFYNTGSTGSHCNLYKGDDPTNPTSWSLHADIPAEHSQDNSGALSSHTEGKNIGGIPWISGDTIVMSQTGWRPNSLVGVMRTGGSIVRSTDGGASWSRVFTVAYGTGNAQMDFGACNIGHDASTGHLYWMSGSASAGSGSDTSKWHRSTDSGATWSTLQNVGPGNYSNPYTTRRNVLYGHTVGGSPVTFSYDAPATDYNTRTTHSTHLSIDDNAKVCRGGSSLYLFSNNTVQWAGSGRRPTVGRIGFR